MEWKAFGRVWRQASIGVLAAALTAPLAWASELELSMANGRVTIRAQDVLIADILAEWGRVGNTAIVDADELDAETVTLELADVPEAKALRTLLRRASGYLAAPRAATSDGVSRFDRILILASSKPAARVATVASPGRVPSSTRPARSPTGQRLGVVPSARTGQTPFTVSAAQQEQLDQLQRLLQQPAGRDAPQPVAVQPAFGSVPASRPGMPMGNGGSREGTVGVPTGAFGSTTPMPETSGTTSTSIPNPRER